LGCSLDRTVQKKWLFFAEGSLEEFYTPFIEELPSGFEVLQTLSLDDFTFCPQIGLDLGTRLTNAAARILEHNRPVIIIGSDMPDISEERLNEAANRLKDNDLVIGPAEDGGYYLIGFNAVYPQLFQEIDWGTDRVLQQTLNAANQLRLKTYLLKYQRDLDTWEDLHAFHKKSAQSSSTEQTLITYRYIEYLLDKYQID
jgi:rSAM/selenodomain-associated transferase 1